MFCWTLAQTTFSSVSGRRQGYLLTSTLPLLPLFSSVSSCPTSHTDDPPGSPFHCPHLNFLASQQLAQGRAPALNNACTVPHIRQCYFPFWFITKVARNKHSVFAILYLQQVTLLWLVEVKGLTEIWSKWVSRSRQSNSGAEKVCKNQKTEPTNHSSNTPQKKTQTTKPKNHPKPNQNSYNVVFPVHRNLLGGYKQHTGLLLLQSCWNLSNFFTWRAAYNKAVLKCNWRHHLACPTFITGNNRRLLPTNIANQVKRILLEFHKTQIMKFFKWNI